MSDPLQKYGGKLQENLMQTAVKKLSFVCARCRKPVGDEVFQVGRFKYGPCCILKVEGAKV